MMTDPISDMLARIRNAHMRQFEAVDIPLSKAKMGVLGVLEREGYINGFKEITKGDRAFLRVTLRYYEGKPVINKIERVSKPSRRVYSKLKKISSVFNGFGIYILSTSKGIMSDVEAREQNVGGEILCKVF